MQEGEAERGEVPLRGRVQEAEVVGGGSCSAWGARIAGLDDLVQAEEEDEGRELSAAVQENVSWLLCTGAPTMVDLDSLPVVRV